MNAGPVASRQLIGPLAVYSENVLFHLEKTKENSDLYSSNYCPLYIPVFKNTSSL
jgi:hypothetical protein